MTGFYGQEQQDVSGVTRLEHRKPYVLPLRKDGASKTSAAKTRRRGASSVGVYNLYETIAVSIELHVFCTYTVICTALHCIDQR